jgi:hypothetical protein
MIDLKKHHWDNVYDLLSGKIDNPKRNWFNRHLVNYGVVNLLYKLFYNEESPEPVGLKKIISGTVEGRNVDLGWIANGKRFYGVMMNAYGLKGCDGCNLENYCECSYVSAGVYSKPNSLFVGFRVPEENKESGNCNSLVHVIDFNSWDYSGRKFIEINYKDRINAERIELGLKLADRVYEVQSFIWTLKQEKANLINSFKQKNVVEKPWLKD